MGQGVGENGKLKLISECGITNLKKCKYVPEIILQNSIFTTEILWGTIFTEQNWEHVSQGYSSDLHSIHIIEIRLKELNPLGFL